MKIFDARSIAVAAVFALASIASTHGAERSELVILPQELTLNNVESRQMLVVQSRNADGQFGPQVANAVLTSSDDKTVRIDNGMAIPVANGKAKITAKSGDNTATAEVTVTGMDQPFTWSFRNHVESVLSKQGCNAGACHGARAGQKGFRLTLFGFDVDADYTYLTRQAIGRRIVPIDPGRSLILTKPTGLLPHKGGVRLDPSSLEYRVLAEWIAAGAPGPNDDDPQIVHVEVLPQYTTQAVGKSQQIVVLAHFNDGHVEDATRWAKYTAVSSTVTSVDERGRVTITGPGEGAIKVW